MSTDIEKLNAEKSTIESLSKKVGVHGYFAQEVQRFYTISGGLLSSNCVLDKSATVDERYLTHVLIRTLLESYFTILYLFDKPSETSTRYDELLDSFRSDYSKLMTDLSQPAWQDFMQKHQGQLELALGGWNKLNGLPNVNTMLTKLTNNYGDRLNYLYPIYRITSFDTHGRSLGAIFKDVFSKQCNFPVVDVKRAFEYIANEYLTVLNNLRANNLI